MKRLKLFVPLLIFCGMGFFLLQGLEKDPNAMPSALLDKPERRKAAISADYVGFACPDKFVVGYGMDMGHAWRQLPFIGYVVPSEETAADGNTGE